MKPTLLTGGHLTQEALDLFVLGALDAADQATLTAHCETCKRCRAQLAELQADQAHFAQFVFPRTVEAIEKRAKPAGFRWRWLVPIVGLAAAAMVAVVMVPKATVDESYVGIKGDGAPVLRVFGRRGKSDVFAVKSGAQLQASDQLRFEAVPAGYSHLLIASVDGQGAFNVYFPFDGTQAAPLGTGTSMELPGSIELDEVKGRERLVVVFAKRPVAADEVRAAVAARPEQPAIEETHITVLEFDKE
jgi:hypothetical protein